MFYNIPDECRKNDAACHNTSQVVKLKIHRLHHLLVLQSGYSVTTDATWKLCRAIDNFVARQKLSSYLVFQLVARHHLNACDIFTLACDKVRLIQVWHQNLFSTYFQHSSNWNFSIRSLWRYIITLVCHKHNMFVNHMFVWWLNWQTLCLTSKASNLCQFQSLQTMILLH